MSWKRLQKAETNRIQPQLIQIGNSIWWSMKRGIVEYDTKSNKIISTTPYPSRVLEHFCLCKCGDIIYVVVGQNWGRVKDIISFNPQTKRFKEEMKIEIGRIGSGARCIAIHDDIHFISRSKHFIYQTKEKRMKTMTTTEWVALAELIIAGYCRSIQIIPRDIIELLFEFYYFPKNESIICDFAIVKYKNKIIKFGGCDCDKNLKPVADFFISSRIDANCQNIEWRKMGFAQCRKPIFNCGYIAYKQWIISFGGKSAHNEYLNEIYILNMNDTTGWIKVKHVKCPAASTYVAALDSANNVHLLDTVYGEHFTISSRKILKKYDSKK